MYARRTFGDINANTRILKRVFFEKIVRKAGGDGGEDAYAQASIRSATSVAGPLHRMVELIKGTARPVQELAAGPCGPYSARVTLKQRDAQFILKSPHTSAHSGLACSKYPSGSAKT